MGEIMGHMNVGQRLEYFRAKKEHTHESLAKSSGVHRVTISAIENNRQSPTVATLAALLRSLDISIAEFFFDASPREINPEHSDLHGKLQEILEGDLKAAQGIAVNIEYIHGEMLSRMSRATRGNGKKKKAEEAKTRRFG
jgi:transcriptional regulator with XRE-family HTH domain